MPIAVRAPASSSVREGERPLVTAPAWARDLQVAPTRQARSAQSATARGAGRAVEACDRPSTITARASSASNDRPSPPGASPSPHNRRGTEGSSPASMRRCERRRRSISSSRTRTWMRKAKLGLWSHSGRPRSRSSHGPPHNMPTTRPARLTAGPPELPANEAASITTQFRSRPQVLVRSISGRWPVTTPWVV